MATAATNNSTCDLVHVGTLELKHKDYFRPWHTSLVVLTPDKVMVTGNFTQNLYLHSLQDGHLLAVSDRLESTPRDICICSILDNEIQVAICLDYKIQIMYITSTEQISTITKARTLNVSMGYDRCHGVKYLNEKLVVCGWKRDIMLQYNLCWGIVSFTDGKVDKVNTICKGGKYGHWSYLSTNPRDDSMIYISCNAEDKYSDTGVYGYRNSIHTFLYKSQHLNHPTAITTDRWGFVFVCNYNPPCIHQLTGQTGQPVTIYREGMPSELVAIFMEEQHGLLYITSEFSKVINIYKPVYSDHQDPLIPAEVLKMDTRSVNMYKDALRDGKEKDYNIRVMVVGQYGVGKTTLTKRLLGKDVIISDRKSTEGIDVDIECCKVSLVTGEWTTQDKSDGNYFRLQRLVKLLNEPVQKMQEEKGTQEVQREMGNVVSIESRDSRYPQHDQPFSTKSDIRQDTQSTSPPLVASAVAKVDENLRVKHISPEEANNVPNVVESSESEKKDAVMEILHLVNKNAAKLTKDVMEYAALAMWDFAGQYIFYTTHQTFLTSRAVYLLVIDLSQQLTDFVTNDECFLDIEGIIACKVHDLVEIWLNSIHSCEPFPEAGIPPVILVGTHVDKIPEKSRKEVIDQYFKKIRKILSDKPVIFHLMDDIAIDNTLCNPNPDPRLKDLQKRIFELAKQQPHWGEEKPARWLPLEQAVMQLKASGVKVAPRSLVEEINRSGSVRIEDVGELDLFLRFHHEIGTIIYYSVEGLRKNIMLDPQWMIDALKSLITAENFIQKNPAITRKWFEFRDKGKLTHELIDAVWSKENGAEFHDHKEYIVLLMEKLNIIARPISYSDDGKEVKVENYFLAPCMLKETTPLEVISPKPQKNAESSSVLCYVFLENFLPTPIFHRLLAVCVAHWPIVKKNFENQIFCGCCVFDLDLHHSLTVFFREHVIFIRVTRVGTAKKTLFYKWCIEVKEFIRMTLTNVIGSLGHSLRFELFIRCPEFDGYNANGLIPVTYFQGNVDVPCNFHHDSHVIISSDVLRFWFPEEKLTQSEVIDPAEKATSTDDKKGKLHQKVLNRCWPDLVKNLDFKIVSIYIQQRELFDDVTLRDIMDQKTTTEQISELLKRIYQRDQETYETFKDCLVQAKQEFLKAVLEKEEAIVAETTASINPEPTILQTDPELATMASVTQTRNLQASAIMSLSTTLLTTEGLAAAGATIQSPTITDSATAESTMKPLVTTALITQVSTIQAAANKPPKTPELGSKSPPTAEPSTKAVMYASETQVSTTQLPAQKAKTTAALTTKVAAAPTPTIKVATAVSVNQASTTQAQATKTSATEASIYVVPSNKSTTFASTAQVSTTKTRTTKVPTTQTPANIPIKARATYARSTTQDSTTQSPTVTAQTDVAPSTVASTAATSKQILSTMATITKAAAAAILTGTTATSFAPVTKAEPSASIAQFAITQAPTTNILQPTARATSARSRNQILTTQTPTVKAPINAALITTAPTNVALSAKTSTARINHFANTQAHTTNLPATAELKRHGSAAFAPLTFAAASASTDQFSITRAPTRTASTNIPITRTSTTNPPTAIAASARSRTQIITTQTPTIKVPKTAVLMTRSPTTVALSTTTSTAATITHALTNQAHTTKLPAIAALKTHETTAVTPPITTTTSASKAHDSETETPTTKASLTAVSISYASKPATSAIQSLTNAAHISTTRTDTATATRKTLRTAEHAPKTGTVTAAAVIKTLTTAAPNAKASTTAVPNITDVTSAAPIAKAATANKASVTAASTTKSLATGVPTSKATTSELESDSLDK